MTLRDKLRKVWGEIGLRNNLKDLFADYAPTIEKVEFSGLFPRVYLVGEYHTEEKHLMLVSDLAKTVKPDVLLWEAINETLRVKNPIFTYRTILSDFGLDDIVPTLLSYVSLETIQTKYGPQNNKNDRQNKLQPLRKNICDELASALSQFSDNPSYLLDTPRYELSKEEADIFLLALKRTIKDYFADVKAAIQQRLDDFDRKPHYTASEETVNMWDLGNALNFIEEPSLSSLREFTGVLLNGKTGVKLNPRQKSLLYLYSHIERLQYDLHISEIVDDDSDLKRRRAELKLYHSCSENNIVICPFDHEVAKGEYKKCFKDGTLLEERAEELNQVRENEMRRVLLMSLRNNRRVITLTGHQHIEDRSPMIGALKTDRIPYCRIVLRPEGSEEDIRIRSIRYDNYLMKRN